MGAPLTHYAPHPHPTPPTSHSNPARQAGRTEHMIILRGNANVAPGGVVELAMSSTSSQAGVIVFQACKRPEGDWSVKYIHPLSCFQVSRHSMSGYERLRVERPTRCVPAGGCSHEDDHTAHHAARHAARLDVRAS